MSSPESIGQWYGHERPVGAPAVRSDPAGEDVLSCPAFPAEEDDRVRRRDPDRGLEERLVRRAPRLEDFANTRIVHPCTDLRELTAKHLRGDDATRRVSHLLGRERLRQVIDRSELHGLHRGLERGEGGDDDRADPRLPAEDLGARGEPLLLAEPEVKEGDIETAPLERFDGPGRRGDAQDPRVIDLEAEPDRLTDARVVVDNQRRPARSMVWIAQAK